MLDIFLNPLRRVYSRRPVLNLAALSLMLQVMPYAAVPAGAATTATLFLSCAPENDLFRILTDNKLNVARYDSPAEACGAAQPGSGLLLLADAYPDRRTPVPPQILEQARTKNLRLYIEYPEAFPDISFGPVTSTTVERAVVTSERFGEELAPLTILTVSGCHYLPTSATQSMISIARVAGYNKAVYGLPKSAVPLLFEVPERNTLVATTCLSKFRKGRYGPVREWGELWKGLLRELSGAEIPELQWKPDVRPQYARDEKLPPDAESRSLAEAAEWIYRSGLLISADRKEEIYQLLKAGVEDVPLPDPGSVAGDGSLGILEGYSSRIGSDGKQRQRLPIRADCHTETAMLLAAQASVANCQRHADTAGKLLDFSYGSTGFCQGERGNPKAAAYGHIAWGLVAPSWEIGNYGDDNARAILATLASGAFLGSDRWDIPAMRAVAANFRTTGKEGFRGDRIDMPELAQKGWRALRERDLVNPSPPFEAWLWACYLWAYQQSGHEPFLSLTRKGIHKTMEVYPSGWRWRDSMERARMLLALAWLVRVEDTPEHRAWLNKVASDLLVRMDDSGAIVEWLGGTGGGHYQVPASNEAFGTGESPLLQENGDPVSDQLYTTSFALVALHEAAAVTGDARLREAEDRLTEYLCRIQVVSESHPYLSGAWLRAFDFKRWDYWASSGDIGWGPWCAEAGWGQTWISLTLALRQKETSLWDLLAAGERREAWNRIREEMEL